MEEETPEMNVESLRWLKKSGWILGAVALLFLVYLFFPVIALLATVCEFIEYETFDNLLNSPYGKSIDWFVDVFPPYEKTMNYLFDAIIMWGE